MMQNHRKWHSTDNIWMVRDDDQTKTTKSEKKEPTEKRGVNCIPLWMCIRSGNDTFTQSNLTTDFKVSFL